MAGNNVALYTLGCKLNYSETSLIGNQFLNKGFDVVDFGSKADVYVINTCTVTENAEKECRQVVRRALRKNPEAFIAVTGCYAQLRPQEIAAIDGVDVVLGSQEKFKLFDYVEQFQKQELSCIHVSPTEELNDSFYTAFSTEADGRTRAFFKIQDGCDYNCSFCTIPLARGKSRSMHPDEAVGQFKKILAEGYKEIILTGVNVGDYGKTLDTNFYGLLKKLLEVPGDYRLRISSIEPNLLSDEIMELVANEEKLASHFHIPLQSGSPEVLKLMKRRYKASFYEELIERVTARIPDVGIGVDVIVGSPGETEENFLETYNFIKELPVSYLHVFTYSQRPNTKAIEMDGHVDVVERKRRNNMLRILSDKKKSLFYQSMKDMYLHVLFENQNRDGYMYGFASNYMRVKMSYDEKMINKFADVKVSEIEKNIALAKTPNEFITKAG